MTACVFLSIQFTPWRKKYICPSVFYRRLSRKQTCGVLELLPLARATTEGHTTIVSFTHTSCQSAWSGAAGIHTERPDWESNTWTFSTWGASANCCTAELSPELSGAPDLAPPSGRGLVWSVSPLWKPQTDEEEMEEAKRNVAAASKPSGPGWKANRRIEEQHRRLSQLEKTKLYSEHRPRFTSWLSLEGEIRFTSTANLI